jgi:hypothetical protein
MKYFNYRRELEDDDLEELLELRDEDPELLLRLPELLERE